MTVATPRRALIVEPVSPSLGAEVSNVDLGDASRNDDLIAELKQLLHRHKVLFFRDQDMSPADHVEFAERFGELETHPLAPAHPDEPKLVVLQRQRARSADNIWHSDLSWRQDPSFGSVLRQELGPAVGGDTMWANMAMAYDRLPDRVKERIGTLRAKHSLEHAFGGSMTTEARAELASRCPMVEHPVVWNHPETDEPILYVNQAFTTHFVNFMQYDTVRVGQDFSSEANTLMTYLQNQAVIPEYQVRLRWRPGTIAFWDNRATQHYAINDYYPEPRRMVRATIAGTPTG